MANWSHKDKLSLLHDGLQALDNTWWILVVDLSKQIILTQNYFTSLNRFYLKEEIPYQMY